MKHIGLSFLSIMILCLQFCFNEHIFADVNNPFELPVPKSSVSHSYGEFSPLINPVFSDLFNAPSLTYRNMRYEDEDRSNHLFLINLAGFTLSYIRLNTLYNYDDELVESAKTGLFSIGRGLWFNNSFGIGLNYSFSRSKYRCYDDYKSWTAGLLFRPFSFISFGFASRDLNSPEVNSEKISRKDIYSVSIRPFGEDITLSFDALRAAGEEFRDSTYIFSTEMKLLREISLFASIDKEKNFSMGISAPIDMSSKRGSTVILDYYGSYNREWSDSSQFGFTLSGERYRSPIITIKRFLSIKMSGTIDEIGYDRLLVEKRVKFFDILNAIRAAAEDVSIEGIIMRIDRTKLGFAQIQEIRRELKRFKDSGKKIYAILAGSGNKDYYLASVSDKIFFIPNSTFSLSGLKAEVYFFKGAFDKVGIRFESVKMGRYKSFNEQFTREHMSDEYRKNLLSILKDLNEQFLNDIVVDRKISRDELKRFLNMGLLKPESALDAGFIDSIEYPDNAVRKIIKSRGFNCISIDLEDYIREKRRVYRWGPIPHISVVYVSGNIIRGISKNNKLHLPESTGDESLKGVLNRVFSDRNIHAVVIRIDSGGGSAVASDLIWHYLIRLKKRYKKPIVISFGNIAASGGYYIACAGDRIFASRGTITGSIGVISGKLSLKRLYEKLGINKDVIKMSEFADIFTESRDMSKREREILLSSVRFIYKRFTERVKEARRIKENKISDVAEGRVFTGSQASKNRLVDNIGGLIAAVEYAKRVSDIRGICKIEHHPKKKGSIMELMGLSPGDRDIYSYMKPLLENFKWAGLSSERFLYLYPYVIEIK